MKKILLAKAVTLGLGGCGPEPIWAPEGAVVASRKMHPGPTSVTLYTVLATRNGTGAHTGLLINRAQLVMFDPAGTWRHPRRPSCEYVHFGGTPKMVNFRIDCPACKTFDVVKQTVKVSPEVAALIIQRAMAYGAVPKAIGTIALSRVLVGVPGFESLLMTWFPKRMVEAFADFPGVETRTITDDDTDDNHGVLLM